MSSFVAFFGTSNGSPQTQIPLEKGLGTKDLSQFFRRQKLDVDHAIGNIFIPASLATATGPWLHTRSGPHGPSGVIPILTPFFAFFMRPIMPPAALRLVDPHTV